MNKAILQIWEESNKVEGLRQDGCSVHINSDELKKYIESIYNDRNENELPDSYERVVGNPTEVEVGDILYNVISRDKSIRLRSYEMNNLLKMEEIVVND